MVVLLHGAVASQHREKKGKSGMKREMENTRGWDAEGKG